LDEKLVTVVIELRTTQKNFHAKGRIQKLKDLEGGFRQGLGREEGRMWVFTRPRGGQDCNLLTGEIRGGLKFCPIHRFDGMNQILLLRMGAPESREETFSARIRKLETF